jgi:hypothetical protein
VAHEAYTKGHAFLRIMIMVTEVIIMVVMIMMMMIMVVAKGGHFGALFPMPF